MGERIYVDRVDWDAADRSPLDYISEGRLRAEDEYEPDTPGATADHDPAIAAWVHALAIQADRLINRRTA